MQFKALHQSALEIVSRYKRAEAELIDVIQKIDKAKAYRTFGRSSLFEYAVKELGLTEDVAYNFINVARKAFEVPALKAAIESGTLTVSKAKKMTSVLTNENQAHWIELARTSSQKAIEKEVAKVNPKAAVQDKAMYVAEKRMMLTMGLSEELMTQFKRVQDLECQRTQRPVDYEQTLKALVDLYLSHKDPMRQNHKRLVPRLATEKGAPPAQTDQAKGEAKPVARPVTESKAANGQTNLVTKPVKDSPKTLTPARKSFILRQNDAQCTYVAPDGRRCEQKRWLHVHHIKERAQGGTHEIENLTILCAAHHRAMHGVHHEKWARWPIITSPAPSAYIRSGRSCIS